MRIAKCSLVICALTILETAAVAEHVELVDHSHPSRDRSQMVAHSATKDAADANPSAQLTTLWESRYISEGRNNLEDGGLFSASIDLSLPSGIALGLWHGIGDIVNYNETNLSIAYGLEFGHLAAGLSYTFLHFEPDTVSDHEIAADLIYTGIGHLELSASLVYSTEAPGSFVTLGAARPGEIADLFTITPSVELSFNGGYVADEHDGINDLRFAIDFGLPIGEQTEIVSFLAYSIGLDAQPGDTLGDEFWGGIGLSVGF